MLGHEPLATTLINAFPVIQYFVLAALVLTLYFLAALSSAEVSHELLAQDHGFTSLAAPSQSSSPSGFEDNPAVTTGTPTSAEAPGIPSPLLARHMAAPALVSPSLSTAQGTKLLLPLYPSLMSKLCVLFLFFLED